MLSKEGQVGFAGNCRLTPQMLRRCNSRTYFYYDDHHHHHEVDDHDDDHDDNCDADDEDDCRLTP